jgi:hypothetical protein
MTRKSCHITRTMVDGWRQPGLVLFLFISGLAPSAYAMSNRRHGGYDEMPLHITAHLQKRDATICPTSYSLCPASLSGGCCPTGSSCGVSSCYPTTAAAPAQCSDPPGYIACGIDEGGRNASSWLFFFITDKYRRLLPERLFMCNKRLHSSSWFDVQPGLRHWIISVPLIARIWVLSQ